MKQSERRKLLEDSPVNGTSATIARRTSCPRSPSTRCEADATSRLMPGSGEGLRRARKTDHSEGYRGQEIPATTSPARTRQRPDQARTQLTDPKPVAEVPLAGLSFEGAGIDAWAPLSLRIAGKEAGAKRTEATKADFGMFELKSGEQELTVFAGTPQRASTPAVLREIKIQPCN